MSTTRSRLNRLMPPLLCVTALMVSAVATAESALRRTNGNPLVPGYFADPSIRKFGDTFYLYSTPDGWGVGHGVPLIWTSKDFVHWTPHRSNWPSTNEKWAPSVIYANSKYYMFSSIPCETWVGVSDSPLGPWKNALGEGPLTRNQVPEGTITLDAEVFQDDDGQFYLAYGTWWTPTIVRLRPDLLAFQGEPMQFFNKPGVKTPNGLISGCMEAPYFIKRNGIYYLMYSDFYCANSTYQVKYSTGPTPFGPWTYGVNNPILATNLDNSVDGPGHHSMVQHDGKDIMVYHRHDNPHDPDGFHRQVCADFLHFGPDNSILPITPSHRGVGFLAPSTVRDTNWVIEPGASITATASSTLNSDFRPENAADINNGTLWKAKDYSFPQWLSLDLGQARSVKRAEIDFMFPALNYRYRIDYSLNGADWKVFIDRTQPGEWRPAKDAVGEAVKGRYFRVTILGDDRPDRPAPETGVWNVRLYDGVDKPLGAPRVEAGADLTCGIDIPRITLQGDAYDPALPFEVNWKKVSGPGEVKFDNSAHPQTAVTFSMPGVYKLALVAKNQVGTATSEVQVTVLDNLAPELLSYNFEEPNDSRILDGSKSSQHGTLTSDGDIKNNPARTNGLFGRALQFDGIKGFVHVPGLGQQRQFTATLWMKLDLLNSPTLLSTADDATRLSLNAEGRLEWRAGDSGARHTSKASLSRFGVGSWVHVGVQHDSPGKRMRFVVNGQAEEWQTLGSSDPVDLRAGVRLGGSRGQFFGGKLDQLRFHRTILDENALRNAAQAPKWPTVGDALAEPDGKLINLPLASVIYAPRGRDGMRSTNWFVVGSGSGAPGLVVRAKGEEVQEAWGVSLSGRMRTDAATGTRYLELAEPVASESAPTLSATPLEAIPDRASARHGELVRLSGEVNALSADRGRLTLVAGGQSLVVVSPSNAFSHLIQEGNRVEVTGVLINGADGVELYCREARRLVPTVDPLEDGLLAYFKFDRNAADGVNPDRPATLRSEKWGNGSQGSALELDGRGADASLPDMGVFPAITFAAWLSLSELRMWQAVFHTDQFDPNRKIHLSLHEDGALLIAASGNSPVDVRSRPLFTQVDVENWKHLAVVYDSRSNQVAIYINGELAQEFKYTNAWPIALNGGMRLGSWGGGDRFFHGKMDEVRFYGRALSREEIQRVMAVGAPR